MNKELGRLAAFIVTVLRLPSRQPRAQAATSMSVKVSMKDEPVPKPESLTPESYRRHPVWKVVKDLTQSINKKRNHPEPSAIVEPLDSHLYNVMDDLSILAQYPPSVVPTGLLNQLHSNVDAVYHLIEHPSNESVRIAINSKLIFSK